MFTKTESTFAKKKLIHIDKKRESQQKNKEKNCKKSTLIC
jgi:hypothetical protein